ncbi:HD domain-containing protein [Cytobacillus sp. S13-E01]|uniref:HD domain-containing phosphohydrolase n=1 Tax=Cytobacillus sp. S13-E01 TaxID=3031326 RepID=UPI0023D83037|nr:HD domain-containing phosphohydrolase [Cytobacillus sp. S13-E01]MDF0725388.1 HD domain-containing protein [Cytobacillus sp. S13-E01]
MSTYRTFVKQSILNYLIGSVVAVVGVGGMFIFSTLQITKTELIYLTFILFSSLIIMCVAELLMFKKHLKPIKQAFSKDYPTLDDIQQAYLQTHRFPILTVKRIFGPHLFGISLPSVIMTILLIEYNLLSFPYRYVLFAIIGAGLIAGMHGLIEFFLTTKAIKIALNQLRKMAKMQYNADISLNGQVLVSIQQKFQLSALFISVFPILLFSLASQIRLQEVSENQLTSYWSWAIVILLVSTFCATYGAYLLFKDISQPIDQLQASMRNIERGEFTFSNDIYSDEFSRVITGFNMMVQGLKERDNMNQQLLNSFYTTLAMTLDARDPYTAGHSIRVANYSVRIAEGASLSVAEIDLLKKSALLHDIGKIGVRDNVLLKDDKLTEDEFAQIKRHPEIGATILLQIQPSEAMEPLIPGVKYHHERYDGNGYPHGLKGEEIPVFGRIMAVADAFDAMTSDRPYRKGMPIDKALTILEHGKGTQWDPYYADLFIKLIRTEGVNKETIKATS